MLIFKWNDVTGLKRLENAMARLDGPQRHMALQRAVNHTGDKALTQVTRGLSKQTGLPYGVIKKALKVQRASGAGISNGEVLVSSDANLSYVIKSGGGDISLKYFKPRQTKAGVTAGPRGQRQLYSGAFIVEAYDSHVFRRRGARRGPLRLLKSGVVIPTEMVSGDSAKIFKEVVETELPKRVLHEIEYISSGIFD